MFALFLFKNWSKHYHISFIILIFMETFAQKIHKADKPFHKLYYEILSRFHSWDYEKALESMSLDLRKIIEDCTQEIQSSN